MLLRPNRSYTLYMPLLLLPMRTPSRLNDIEQLLHLHDEFPLILTDIAPEEFLECINTLPADCRVKRVFFF